MMQFGGLKNPFANKRDGATTVSLTLSFRATDRGPRSLLGQLEAMAADADTSSNDGISALCSSTALLLLRRQNEWLSCCGNALHNGREEEALSNFDRLAIREAAKFDERDASATVDAALAAAGVAAKPTGASTLAVVCAVGCVLGDRAEALGRSFQGDARAMRGALEELAAAANADEEVFAFELFWVPGDDEEVLEMDAVFTDWPELMPC
jgi:uncharacterized membrane protein